MTTQEFNKIIEISQPHKVLKKDWNNYYSLQFADIFLPKVKGYIGEGARIFDGANLFENIKLTKRDLQVLTNDDLLISIVGYTFPIGVEASKKINSVHPKKHEILFFTEVFQNEDINLTIKYGNDLKEIMKDLKPQRKIIKTTVNDFKKHFNDSITHKNLTSYILKSLGIERETKEEGNYNQFFNTKVLSYLENTKILNKYKVQLFIVKSQTQAGLESGDLDFKPVKVFKPLSNEIFIWLVSEDNVKFDTSFLKIKVGANVTEDFRSKKITLDSLTNNLLTVLKSEVEQQTFSKAKIEQVLDKGLASSFFILYSLDKIKSNPIAKEVFSSSPIAFYMIEGLNYFSQKIDNLKLSENTWNPRIKP